MKIIRARFENFRLLRELELNFSTDPDKRLTVLRAENESGKTTILTGLQWGLYGDLALGKTAGDFRLHPIDWVDTKVSIPISVEIDMEITRTRRTRKGVVLPSIETYRVIRTAHETISGNKWSRDPDILSMFRLTDTGGERVDQPRRILAQELPLELREVFFTDGDRTLNFIEADTSSKRENVEKAIRSLLGLDVIKGAQGHIQTSVRAVNRKAKNAGADNNLDTITSSIEQIGEEKEKHEEIVADAKTQIAEITNRINETRKKIDDALIKGDKAALQRDLQQARNAFAQTNKEKERAAKDHAGLFRTFELSRDLLGSSLQRSIDMLDGLRKRGQFPKTAIPVLQDRLQAAECICGASLSPNDPETEPRRQHIYGLIEQSRKSDELQSVLTDLFFASANLQIRPSPGNTAWVDRYASVAERRDTLDQAADAQGHRISALDAQVGQLEDVDIEGLRDYQRRLTNLLHRQRDEQVRSETHLDSLKKQERELSANRDTLLKKQAQGTRILAEFDVVQDISSVLQRAYERMTNEELTKVSNLMNTYFLEMIGADPEQGSLVRRAEISTQFDILVYGWNDRELNPDHDLNGASRRALTLAFILALTKVSEVEAPNIIDTPLGMMSGYVKRSVLRTAIRESSQLVLFLTRSEIAGCEDILDARAGEVSTLTNPAHYPLILEHEPEIAEATIIRCDCNHRVECRVCQRRVDALTAAD